MHWKMRLRRNCVSFFLILLVFSATSLARYTGVDLDVGGFSKSLFDNNAGSYVIGSYGYVVVAVNSSDFDTKPVGSFNGKPEWLSLEFGYGTMGEEFKPSEEVTRQFSPVYFVDHVIRDAQKTANFFFAVDLPRDLQDTLYCVRAIVDPPPYGPISYSSKRYSKLYECFRVISPSSDADHDRILASRTDILFRMADYSEIVELADSLDRIDRRVESVMGTAIEAAIRLERYDLALYYLDKRHEVFGEKPHMHMSDLPPFDSFPIEPQDAADARFRKQRLDLLGKIDEKGGK